VNLNDLSTLRGASFIPREVITIGLKLITAPTVEPVTLAEVKGHLRLDSGSLADNITSEQSIALASHDVAAAYSLEGTAIDVLGYQVVVVLECGTNGGGGTIDVKLQHRDTLTDTWTDVVGGAFAQVTAANDNATYELDYTGGKKYLRAVSTVAGAACIFGVTIQKIQVYSAEDSLLTGLIQAAREYVEDYQNRALCTQTWELVLDSWPVRDYVELPKPPLQSIVSIKYKDKAGTESTWADTNYIVDPDSFLGRVVLADGISWPTATLYPAGGIRIQFVAGYGLAADVPQTIRQAMLLLIGHLYENREAGTDRALTEIPFGVKSLLDMNRVVPI
jgi:uncharacterized phiE125 gp8 family phage protein